MDSSSLIVGLVIVVISLIPIYFIRRNRKNKEKLIVKSIHDLAKNENHNISQYECFRDFVIGLDKNDKFLFFSQIDGSQVNNQCIDLSDFTSCENKTISSTVDGNKLVEKVQLRFINSKKAIIQTIELFDIEKHIQVRGELQLSQKWSVLVNKLLD